MIIVRSPLRITLGGGGSDVTSFSSKHGGFCVSATIDKYVYISVHRTFVEEIILKYSKLEQVKNVNEIEHPIIREAINLLDFKTPQLEITSHADVPSNGTGLGSSGSFTVALIKALYLHRNINISPEEVAELACDINMNKLGMIQGKQDEYISSLGGIVGLNFNKDGSVTHKSLNLDYETIVNLEESLMLFYTGAGHNTNRVLAYQDKETKSGNKFMIKNLLALKEIGLKSKKTLEDGRLSDFYWLMNDQWENKKARTIQGEFINSVRNEAMKNGALGMKLVGSGENGFFLCYTQNRHDLRRYMQSEGLEELRFRFDFQGTQVLYR